MDIQILAKSVRICDLARSENAEISETGQIGKDLAKVIEMGQKNTPKLAKIGGAI